MKPQDFSVFAKLVSSFRLVEPEGSEDFRACVLRRPLPAWKGDVTFLEPEQQLWFDPTIAPGLDSLKKKLEQWLIQLDHPTGDDVILSLLGLLAMGTQRGKMLVDQITGIQATLQCADVSHFFVFPKVKAMPSNAKESLLHEEFTLGQLNSTALEIRCKRAGSDFYSIYGASLTGCYALQSPIYKRGVFNWLPFLNEADKSSSYSLSCQLVLPYFEAVAGHHQAMMWNDFSEKQLLYSALGSHILNVRQVSREPGMQIITIYLGLPLGQKSVGYVVPSARGRVWELPEARAKSEKLESLRQKYGFDKLGSSSVYPLLRSVCRSAEQAEIFRSEERMDEALLYSVIALEQVFSERENTSKKVANRAALVVHRQLGLPFEAAMKKLEELYNLRSRFVHGGKAVPTRSAFEIMPVVVAVIKSLIQLCRTPTSLSEDDFKKQWLKNLDFMTAGFEAGVEPSAEMALANGIIDPDDIITP